MNTICRRLYELPTLACLLTRQAPICGNAVPQCHSASYPTKPYSLESLHSLETLDLNDATNRDHLIFPQPTVGNVRGIKSLIRSFEPWLTFDSPLAIVITCDFIEREVHVLPYPLTLIIAEVQKVVLTNEEM